MTEKKEKYGKTCNWKLQLKILFEIIVDGREKTK